EDDETTRCLRPGHDPIEPPGAPRARNGRKREKDNQPERGQRSHVDAMPAHGALNVPRERRIGPRPRKGHDLRSGGQVSARQVMGRELACGGGGDHGIGVGIEKNAAPERDGIGRAIESVRVSLRGQHPRVDAYEPRWEPVGSADEVVDRRRIGREPRIATHALQRAGGTCFLVVCPRGSPERQEGAEDGSEQEPGRLRSPEREDRPGPSHAGKQPRRSSVVHGKPAVAVLPLSAPSPARSVVRLGLLVLVAALSGGCRACANDHPYVPPATEASSGVSSTDAAAPPISSTTLDSGANLVEPALVAPPASTSWQTNGMTLEAGGREFVLALVGDFDGDAKKDALAIVRPVQAERKPGSSTGELVFFHGGGDGFPAGAIASGPALGVQPSCVPTARLEKIGPRSAFAEIGSSCPKGDGSRAIIVVRLSPPAPAVAFDAIVSDPLEAPKLSIDADAADRDHDGLDDVVLRLGIEGGGPGGENAPRLGARLAFFDRPAGPSRDPDEPDASLRAIASQAAARATKAKDAASVPPLVHQMRALYRAMCLEGGAPRVTKIHGGSGTSCGSSKPLEDAGVAEVRAWVTQGDALRAFAAAENAQVAPATRTAAKTAELQKMLGEVAPVVEARSVRTLAAQVDVSRGGGPEWGPLAFEYTGKLLVRHGKSVMRVDPETGEGEPADMVGWKDEVLSPDGKNRWLEAYHACEGVALRATFAPTGDGEMSDVALPIAPRLGKACNGGRGEAASAVPIAWGERGLEAIVAGQPVLIKTDPPQASALAAFTDETPPPGSPRSHGAKTLALAMPNGILVRARDRWSMVRSADLEPYADVRRCTINDDGSRLACVRRRSAVVVTLP
ncbi:MAG: hypothetical protein K0S65_943, partial [Labilithrix sp.]|nr:hypothetical protein [Labilithrix sp.]